MSRSPGRFARLFREHLLDLAADGIAKCLAALLMLLLVPLSCRMADEAVGTPKKVGVHQQGLINIHWEQVVHPPKTVEPPTPPPPLAGTPIHLPGGEATGFERTCRNERNEEIGKLRLVVFSREYRWECGSSTKVITPDGADFANQVLSTQGLQSYLKADEIVAVGMASCDTDDRRSQNCLAYDRALTLQSWVRRTRQTTGRSRSLDDVHTLNLGQLRPPAGSSCDMNKCADTGSQRVLMLIGVSGRGVVPFKDCLKDILQNDPEPVVRISGYPLFELDTPMPERACPGA